jgi:hypothetical protein
MPVLPNPRHEKFAQALARGMSASAAIIGAAAAGIMMKIQQSHNSAVMFVS